MNERQKHDSKLYQCACFESQFVDLMLLRTTHQYIDSK